jgi:hypothetical protein
VALATGNANHSTPSALLDDGRLYQV